MSGRPRRRRTQAGFTLTELLLGILLTSLFAAGLYAFFFSGLDASRTHESQARAQSQARSALDRLAREARQAVSPDDGLTAPVFNLTPTAIEMYVDPSRATSAVRPKPWKVRYSLSGTRLVRQFSVPIGTTAPYTYAPYGAEEVLIEKVPSGGGAIFSAVTEEGDALPSSVSGPLARDIALVSVRVVVAQRTGGAASTMELGTDVELRNAISI